MEQVARALEAPASELTVIHKGKKLEDGDDLPDVGKGRGKLSLLVLRSKPLTADPATATNNSTAQNDVQLCPWVWQYLGPFLPTPLQGFVAWGDRAFRRNVLRRREATVTRRGEGVVVTQGIEYDVEVDFNASEGRADPEVLVEWSVTRGCGDLTEEEEATFKGTSVRCCAVTRKRFWQDTPHPTRALSPLAPSLYDTRNATIHSHRRVPFWLLVRLYCFFVSPPSLYSFYYFLRSFAHDDARCRASPDEEQTALERLQRCCHMRADRRRWDPI